MRNCVGVLLLKVSAHPKQDGAGDSNTAEQQELCHTPHLRPVWREALVKRTDSVRTEANARRRVRRAAKATLQVFLIPPLPLNRANPRRLRCTSQPRRRVIAALVSPRNEAASAPMNFEASRSANIGILTRQPDWRTR